MPFPSSRPLRLHVILFFDPSNFRAVKERRSLMLLYVL